MVTDVDTLVEGLQDGELHGSSQIGLTRQDEDGRVIGVHLEVGQQPEVLQGSDHNS